MLFMNKYTRGGLGSEQLGIRSATYLSAYHQEKRSALTLNPLLHGFCAAVVEAQYVETL